MTRAVVVGGGLGGLAVAARLAASGQRVTLLEAAERVGGKLGTVEVDGFRFDTGPSLVTMPAVLERLFADTGLPLHDVLGLQRLDVAARYRFGDGVELDLPGRREQIAPALDDALGAGAGTQWEAFLAHAERVWDATHEHFLESPVSPGGLARLSLRVRDVLAVAPWRSLRGVGDRYLRDERLGLLLDRYATYSGSDPRRAPAALAVVPYVEQQFGSWYVRGGLRRLAEAVADRCRSLGVELRTGTRVAAIDTVGDRVSGVRLADGERLAADVVVANADAATVYGPDGLLPHAASARRLARTTPSSSGFVLLLGLAGRDIPGPGTPHHRVLFPPSRAAYDAEFDAYRGGAPASAPAVYVHAPDDPALRPGGDGEGWFVLVTAPRHDPAGGVDWDAPGLAPRYAERILEVMARRGLDVRHRIRSCTVRTPADLERETLAPGGSIYGTSSDGALAAFLRPANRSPVAGLYLVGGSSHPGGGLPLVTLSAEITARLVRSRP
ncbi:phytoene desaturase family protein [Actinomycetospora straminea]|uniref:Phytoene desaturase family protein n=1 Tax=Actinomycetospora straminea TaxID=663607 RepID=A0ABP9F6H5_9PSEU|nr:phytoene desaturase family protein [Actinomycetospora straminea]MDD7936138.1 phytoene desaturase family protein [Actinomycetospora straminea]